MSGGRLCLPKCGDGIVISPEEQCDLVNSPACTDCSVNIGMSDLLDHHSRLGYRCKIVNHTSNCSVFCGDGIVISPEQCDQNTPACTNCIVNIGRLCSVVSV